jgi:hypothetical protein
LLRTIPGLLAIAVGLATLPSPAETGRAGVDQAAARFAQAICSGNPDALHAILPQSGKILVSIPDAGHGAGYYGSSQVEALFGGYLAEYGYLECRIDHLELQDSSYARIDIIARRSGSGADRSPVVFRLALQPEQGLWVLREIRESLR